MSMYWVRASWYAYVWVRYSDTGLHGMPMYGSDTLIQDFMACICMGLIQDFMACLCMGQIRIYSHLQKFVGQGR